MSRAFRIGAFAVAGGLWAAAAWRLSASVVPSRLDLPHVDEDTVFGAALVHRAERYERIALALWVLSQVALVATLVLYAQRGVAFVRESSAGPIGTGMLLGMLGLGIVWLVQLPFGLVGLWWERRHDLTEIGYLEWAFGGWAELGGAFLSICLALLVVMGLARRLGERWWVPGALAFVVIATSFAWVSPYLVSTKPLRDRGLVAAARAFEREQGVGRVPVRVESVSGSTSQANAYAFGLGPSRRVVLWDTLLDGRFGARAVRVVLAHEIAHQSSRHIAKALSWFGLFALPGAWVLMLVTRRRGGMGVPEAVPLALLAMVVIQLALSPAQAWVSRGMEREADWKALATTRDPAAARRLFVTFARTSLADPTPPRWAHVLFGSHPTLAERVAMADAWQRRRR